MYSKLAFRNVKRSFRDYAIYFLTLMFGVCIFYIFNSIDAQSSMMVISESTLESMETLQMILSFFSVFVAVILGFLIVYANRFLVRRRKKELGIYQMLGMEKGQISRILIIETMFVAISSLAVGLVVGIFLSQGFAVLTASLFEVKLSEFKFVFSSAAAIKAILYFGIAFLLVLIFNQITIGKQKLIHLLYAERKNEKFKTPHLTISVILFVVSLVCFLIAYYLVLKQTDSYRMKDSQLLVATILGGVGTLLFFISLSGFFLKIIQQMKGVYFKGLNMFVLRQINSKINTAYVSITMVCLMLFLAICGLSFGMGFSQAIASDLEHLHPHDATTVLAFYTSELDEEVSITGDGTPVSIDIMKEFDKVTIPTSSYAKEISVVRMYVLDTEPHMYDEFASENHMTLSEYNTCLELQGKETVTLRDNEMIFNCINEECRENFGEYISHNQITISGVDLELKKLDDTVLRNTFSMSSYDCIRILPDALFTDELIANARGYLYIINIQFIESTVEYEDLYFDAIMELFDNIGLEYQTVENSVSSMIMNVARIENFESNKSYSVTIAYLAVYLGVIFLVMAAVVLAIAQLSESSDNAQRYTLLRKLGVDDRMINKALFSQIAIYFGVPLLLAIVHSIVGIRFSNQLISEYGRTSILRDSVIAGGILITIYGGYFLATYWVSKRIVGGGLH